jgi:hypothetical protein
VGSAASAGIASEHILSHTATGTSRTAGTAKQREDTRAKERETLRENIKKDRWLSNEGAPPSSTYDGARGVGSDTVKGAGAEIGGSGVRRSHERARADSGSDDSELLDPVKHTNNPRHSREWTSSVEAAPAATPTTGIAATTTAYNTFVNGSKNVNLTSRFAGKMC